MNQNVTLYRIIKLFEDYQKSQQNIGLNGFGYGNLIDFGQNLTGGTQTNYPFMFVTPQLINYNENITTYTMSIIFADRLNDDKANIVDVQSDMSIQAKRLMGWIRRGINNTPDLFDNMDIVTPVAGIPFLERFNDYVGGIAIDAEIIVQESIDSCNYYEPVPPNPNTIPNLLAWYDLQDVTTITSSGTTLISVDDKSLNGYTLSNATGPVIEYVSSTLPNFSTKMCVYFSGASTMDAILPSIPLPVGATMFAVFGKLATNAFIIQISSGGTYTAFSTTQYGLSNLVTNIRANTNGLITTINCGLVVGDCVIAGASGDNTGVSDFEVNKANVVCNTTIPTSTGATETTFTQLKVGTGGVLALELLELVVYDRILTNVEYNVILDYLKNKYNYNNWL